MMELMRSKLKIISRR